ncbi:MAG: hypothetical protein K8S21_11740 [Gemmatimonadetes bacterium]|nr:hypothetical protein [Gemmatimonadota bacterium]
MNIILAISTVALAVQAAACLVALAISRAPGWRRARIAAVLAGTAGLYSILNILGLYSPATDATNAWVSSGRLGVAAAHVAAWIWFSYSDHEGRWRTVPRTVRWVVVAHLALTFLLSATGNANDPSRLAIVEIARLGVRFVQPALTPGAMLSAATSLGFLFVSFVEQVRQARRGVAGAKWNVLGFVVFVVCAVDEILVASNVVSFIYLAELGYLGLVVPMVAQFVRRFIGDAHRLQVLTAVLESEIQVATGERDSALEALAAQERFAALGRMAGGVGHEINNPLQILTLSLDELRETPSVTRDPDVADMVESAVAASERIRRIVAGLRTYALPGEPSLRAHAPAAVVRDAIAAARREPGPTPEILEDLGPAPEVLVDRERMLQALGHAIANAVRAVSALPDGTGRVELRTRTTTDGDALIEVRDTGGGFPASVLSRLGEPFVTTQAPGAGLGLGVFIIRGVVAAHGGLLELENGRGGGACVRILLPPASRD